MLGGGPFVFGGRSRSGNASAAATSENGCRLERILLVCLSSSSSSGFAWWTGRRVVGQEAMDLADGAAAEMLVMMDDEAVEWCKTGMELFLFEGGHLNGAGCLI